jgi:hypothetical protein
MTPGTIPTRLIRTWITVNVWTDRPKIMTHPSERTQIAL